MLAEDLAQQAGIPFRVWQTIRAVESHGSASAIRFEPHIFRRLTAHKYDAKIPFTPGPEGFSRVRAETDRGAFNRAFLLDAEAAVRATSWGAGQVLGAWLLRVDGDPGRAVALFDRDPVGTGDRMMVAWWRAAKPSLRDAATKEPPDFLLIARAYNGPGNAAHYAAALEREYAKTV